MASAFACAALGIAGCAQVPPGTASGTPSSAASPVAAPTASDLPASVAPAASPTASATPTPDADALTVVMSGDMLWHDSLMKSVRADAAATGSADAEDYGPLLQHVAPLMSDADVAVCHTEVPFARPGEAPAGYPRFAAPASVTRAYTTLGFDVCTTASNHSLDRGFGGLVHTLDVLETELGIVTAGTNRGPGKESAPRLLTTAGGVRIAVVTGTYASNSGFDAARPWALDTLKADGLVARAKAARASGADIVIAALHAGQEYVTAPTAQQRDLARVLAASGTVDLVYGHHAHTVQPIERIGDTWVAYGLGNLVGQMKYANPRAMEGLVLRATFGKAADGRWSVTRLAYVPLLVTWHTEAAGPARIYPINDALRRGVGPTEHLRRSLGYVRAAVGSPAGLVEE